MLLKKSFSRTLCFTITILLSIGSITPVAMPSYADSALSDISQHWSEDYVKKAVEQGFVQGYQDGTFRPDNPITRAEFVKMLNTAIGNNFTAPTNFSDVSSGSWYSGDVSKAVAAAYVSGYDDGTFLPSNSITRQEAAVMLARIVPTYGSSRTLKVFGDYAEIGKWAYDAMAKIYGKGYIGPYSDSLLHPTDKLTRAQAAKIIVGILESETIYKDNLEIQKSGIVLTNAIYANRLSVGSVVGDGSVTINNSVILGNLNVMGGGEDTVSVINSRVASATVRKQDSTVRFKVTGESCVKSLVATDLSTIQQDDLAGDLFGTGIEKIFIGRAAYATLIGNFPSVSVTGAKVDLTLKNGAVEDFTINKDCTLGTIMVASDAAIKTATVNSSCDFIGSGEIKKMYINAAGVTYVTKPDEVIIGEDLIDDEETSGLAINIRPADNSENVSADSEIILSFEEPVLNSNGTPITTSNIPFLVTITSGSASGTTVPYTATINSSKTEIRIIPDRALSPNTKYFISLKSGVVQNESGIENAAKTFTFNTGSSMISAYATFTPANGTLSVPASVSPIISFTDNIVRYTGSQITTEYLISNAIAFKNGSASGSDVSFTASIDSTGKIINIYPTSRLSENATYYLGIKTGALKTTAGIAIPATGVTWTVESSSLSNIKVNATDTTLEVTSDSKASGTIYAVAVSYQADAPVPSAANISEGLTEASTKAISSAKAAVNAGGSSKIVLSGLTTSTKYNIYLVLKDSSSVFHKVFTTTGTTDSMRLNTLSIIPIDASGNYGANALADFSPSQTNYLIRLPGDTSSVKITPDAGSFGGTLTVKVNGATINYTTGTASLDRATNYVIITATESGKTPKSYNVTLAKPPLISALFCGGSSSTVKLSGSTYTYNMPGSLTTVDLVINLSLNGSNYSNGVFEVFNTAGNSLGSAKSGNPLLFTPGSSTSFEVKVYNEDKTASDSYTLKLNRY